MTLRAEPRAGMYLALVALGLVAGVASGRAELVVVAIPFALVFVAAAGTPRAAGVVTVSLDPLHARQGDLVRITFAIRTTRGAVVEVVALVPEGLSVERESAAFAVSVGSGSMREVSVDVRCDRWGTYALGAYVVRTRDLLGLTADEREERHAFRLVVEPRPEPLRSVVSPRRTQLFAGDRLARTRGEGIEFAERRPYAPGDDLRRIDWRATARRGDVWIAERHPERNGDVVLFVDAFTDFHDDRDGTLDMTVRAALGLGLAYLARRDQVGVVSFGGTLRWLEPAGGLQHRLRLRDALAATDVAFSYAWKDVAVVPPRALPPAALVVVLSPFVDQRAVHAVFDLVRRGYDVTAVEISPVPFVAADTSDVGRVAHDIWLMQRAALRSRLRRVGVAVATWEQPTAFASVIEELERWRRYARIAV